MIRRAWMGEPPRERLDDQIDVYRSYSPTSAQQHWGGDELVDAPTPEQVVAGLIDAVDRAGADALNLRVHVPGVSPEAARGQIAQLGDEVLPRLRAALPDRTPA
jgi:hypothetical protein